MKTKTFTFNGFQENTYILYDETKECIIFDPGCNTRSEEQKLSEFIKEQELTPVMLVNTHCHIDHILGNNYVFQTYGLKPLYHKGEQIVMDSGVQVAQMYGINYTTSPNAESFIDETTELKFGNQVLKSLFTPGHSPASLSFYNEAHKTLIAGDVLFEGSVGRSDLPGGDHHTLIESIKTQLLVLPDDVVVYPGHGYSTTIGKERRTNPFLN